MDLSGKRVRLGFDVAVLRQDLEIGKRGPLSFELSRKPQAFGFQFTKGRQLTVYGACLYGLPERLERILLILELLPGCRLFPVQTEKEGVVNLDVPCLLIIKILEWRDVGRRLIPVEIG